MAVAISVYAERETKLLENLVTVLERCEIFGVKLHPKKCFFLTVEIVRHGKKIAANGVSHCADLIQGLCEMRRPITGPDLQQFFCAVKCMRNNVPKILAAGTKY